MMRYVTFILAVAVLILLFVNSSFAQEATSPGAKRGSLKDTILMKRQEASLAAKTTRDTFKTRLSQIKDQRKKATVERVQARIDQINQKRTEQMGEFLERLTKILDKIESRKEKAKAKGADVAAVETAISEAKAAIKAASDAVQTQAGKSYVITISDEGGLRNAVGSAMSSLQSDLQATRKIVTEAKQVVMKVISLIRGVKGVDDD